MKRQTIFVLFATISLLFSCKTAKYQNLGDGMFADVQTNKGDIVLALEFEKTPVTVANFVSLAEGTNQVVDEKYRGKHFYDGIVFHRVVENFVIQGGDPEGTGRGGTGYRFADEFPKDAEGNLLLKHDGPGILSMANSGPNTNSSQFFITHRATPHLDGKHSVFGHVVIGQEVVDSIEQGDVINKVDIIRNGKAAKAFKAAEIIENHLKDFEAEQKKMAEESEKRAKNAEIAKVNMGNYIKSQKAKAKKYPSGLQMIVLEKGTGVKPPTGSEVFINYAGYFEDGRMFDTSWVEKAKKFNVYNEMKDHQDAYKPFPRKYSLEAKLIPGFREAMLKMSYGEKALVFIPSHLGYGEKGVGRVIPPNKDLVFELEIVDTRAKE